jgi:GNAT superfamily N-acetyltransferase
LVGNPGSLGDREESDGRRSYEAVGYRLEPGKQKEMRFAGGTAIEVGYRKPLKAETTRKIKRHSAFLFSILMDNPTVIFDPHAAGDLRNIVQTIVDNHNVAITGQAEWYPVAFFLKNQNGEVLGGLLGDIWAAWLHIITLAVAAPVRGHGFGKELMMRAELYAVERGCTDAFLDTFSFQARPFYEKLGYRVFGMLENHRTPILLHDKALVSHCQSDNENLKIGIREFREKLANYICRVRTVLSLRTQTSELLFIRFNR